MSLKHTYVYLSNNNINVCLQIRQSVCTSASFAAIQLRSFSYTSNNHLSTSVATQHLLLLTAFILWYTYRQAIVATHTMLTCAHKQILNTRARTHTATQNSVATNSWKFRICRTIAAVRLRLHIHDVHTQIHTKKLDTSQGIGNILTPHLHSNNQTD